MKGVIVNPAKLRILNPTINQILTNYLLFLLKYGLYGFAAFFTILIYIKAVLLMFGSSEDFLISTGDVLLSTLGIGLVFIFKLFKDIYPTNKRK